MLFSPELAELVKVRLSAILKKSKDSNVSNMLSELMQDVDKHTGIKKRIHRCFRCGKPITKGGAYCSDCMRPK